MSRLVSGLAILALTAPGIAVRAAPPSAPVIAAAPPPCPGVAAAPKHRAGSRVVGGHDADPRTVPWQVELMAVEVDPTLTPPNNRNFRAADLLCAPAQPLQCGGALIAPGWVLTAAHCVVAPRAALRLQVMTGSQVLSRPGPIHPILGIIVHEDYQSPSPDYDIALVHYDVGRTAPAPETLTPAREATLAPIGVSGIVKARPPEAGLNVSVTGWGRAYATTAAVGQKNRAGRVTTYADLAKDALQEADLVVVAQRVCQSQIDKTSLKGTKLTPRMFCAASADKAKKRDACSGDSGGPIFHQEQGRWILDGVVSFGDNDICAETSGVYTRVDRFAGWIERQMGPGDAATLIR